MDKWISRCTEAYANGDSHRVLRHRNERSFFFFFRDDMKSATYATRWIENRFVRGVLVNLPERL